MVQIKKYNGGEWVEMTLSGFFNFFSLDELVDLYTIRIHDDLAKDTIKEIIMKRLEITNSKEFDLWIKLF